MSFLDDVRTKYGESKPVATAVPPVATVSYADKSGTPYALRALSNEVLTVANTPEGQRNGALNTAGYNLAQLVAGGELEESVVRTELTQAARQAGLNDLEIKKTLDSAFRGGAEQPRHAPDPVSIFRAGSLPKPRDVAPSTLAPAVTEPAPAEAPDMFARDLAIETYRQRIRDAAQRALLREQRTAGHKLQLIELPDFLARTYDDPKYRITDVWPTGGRVIFSAQYKAGKSTAVGNVIRSLADGEPFLDKFDTEPVGRIVLIDNELDERTLQHWLADQGIETPEALALVPLRGQVATFDILDPDTRAQWAAVLKGADVVILDCLRPVLDALGLSEDKDAGQFLSAFDALLYEAGVGEAIVVHHMGHSGARSRGDSRILDWPDATWRIVREDAEDPSSTRFFSAFGRDVEVGESELAYNPFSRRLTIIGGSRTSEALDAAVRAILSILSERDAMGAPVALPKKDIEDRLMEMGHRRATVRAAVDETHNRKLITITRGPRAAALCQLITIGTENA